MVARVSSNNVFYSFSPEVVPAIIVDAGSIVEVETLDCFSNQIVSENQLVTEIDFSKVNPATGPIYVKNAKRGDALKVKVLDIKVNDRGVIVSIPRAGVLGDKVSRAKTKFCYIKDGYVYFNNIKIKAKPMIGVIGVAPDKPAPTGTPGRHGGNLDTKLITIGSTIYLPVYREGGLLGIGDLHAVIGDGEICVAACEVSGRVLIEVDIVKDLAPKWPIVETDEAYYILVSREDLWEAFSEATDLAVKALAHSNSLEWEDAYMLASMVVDIQVSQLVNPLKTVRARIPKDYISLEKLLEAVKAEDL